MNVSKLFLNTIVLFTLSRVPQVGADTLSGLRTALRQDPFISLTLAAFKATLSIKCDDGVLEKGVPLDTIWQDFELVYNCSVFNGNGIRHGIRFSGWVTQLYGKPDVAVKNISVIRGE